VFRTTGGDGRIERDVLALEGERHPGEPLLRPALRAGKRLAPAPALEAIRGHALGQLERLAPALRRLKPAEPPFRPEVSAGAAAAGARGGCALQTARRSATARVTGALARAPSGAAKTPIEIDMRRMLRPRWRVQWSLVQRPHQARNHDSDDHSTAPDS
jgi:hypothetical protein